ncbi:MAG: zinc dependent phospholipase C family protein [Spirochaetia bacterium]
MPSHIAHNLFSIQSIKELIQNDTHNLDPSAVPFLYLGAQGPDIFFHNQRTKPSGLAYGIKLHSGFYGKCCAVMAEILLDKEKKPEEYYLYGFITHAVLDRYTHPFIISRSGKETAGAHAFYERIIDVLMLNHFENKSVNQYDFLSTLPPGNEIPGHISSFLADTLTRVFPRSRLRNQCRERVENAFYDTLSYYSHTNFIDKEYICRALEREDAGEMSQKWITIVHPRWFPEEYDYLNDQKRVWTDPWSGKQMRESFVELWDSAKEEARRCLKAAFDVLNGKKPPGILEEVVGNGPLGGQEKNKKEQSYETPLPFSRILSRVREQINGECSS